MRMWMWTEAIVRMRGRERREKLKHEKNDGLRNAQRTEGR
jgi:hypothetical protein